LIKKILKKAEKVAFSGLTLYHIAPEAQLCSWAGTHCKSRTVIEERRLLWKRRC
jgi:hypothetical protein